MNTAKLIQSFWLSVGVLPRKRDWRHWFVTLGLTAVMTVIAAETLLQGARAAILSDWRFDEGANQLEIMVVQGTQPTYSILNQPPRLVLDLPNTELGVSRTQQVYSGSVRQIQMQQLAGGWTRIILEFAPGIILDPSQVDLQRVAAPIEIGPFRDRWLLRTFIAESPRLPAREPIPLADNRGMIEKYPPLPTNFNSQRIAASGYPPPALSGQNSVQNSASGYSPPALSGQNSERIAASGYPDLPLSGQNSAQNSASAYSLPPLSGQNSASEFGQPLPSSSSLPELPVERSGSSYASPTPSVVVPPLANQSTKYGQSEVVGSSTAVIRQEPYMLLPVGTVMNLRYPGRSSVALDDDFERQEVLLLLETIRDRDGNVVVPEGTPVIGRFQTNRRGSRFVAQAITLFGRNVPLSGESERLRKVDTLEPGQIFQIRLKDALR